MTEQEAGTQAAPEAVVLERRRLRVMELGLAVAIVAALAALIVPFATGALAFEETAETRTQEQIAELLDRTARLEEGQQNLKRDFAELKLDVKDLRVKMEGDLNNVRETVEADFRDFREKVEADFKDIRTAVADNKVAIARNQATLESIERLLATRLPEPQP